MADTVAIGIQDFEKIRSRPPFLERVIMTGITRVSKEAIFSDMERG
ncbi:MAG: hypothetical protein HFJ09_09985 [Lachnospiraceae bacterium]|nr:hypothetical protein [Lachnospiraceae bacterium]